jgi:hypothetical protein
MAILGAITTSLKKAITKVGRKSKADNKVITDAFKKSTFTSRPKFVIAAEKAIKQTDNKKDKTVTGKKTKKGKKVPLTAKEQKELDDLIEDQTRDRIAHSQARIGSTGSTSAGTQKITIPVEGSKRERKVAHPFGARKGREEHSTKEWTPAEIEEQQDKGSGGTGSVNWNLMRGKDATKEQLDEIEGLIKGGEGFRIEKKHGGSLKKPVKKKTVFRRGGGQALRGFGKATYSNKLY